MPRTKGALNKLYSTHAQQFLWKHFLRPFAIEYRKQFEYKNNEDGIDQFFALPDRRVAFCKATRAFTIPGPVWASPEQPFNLVPGVGDRKVKVGDALVIRVDRMMPERNEIEFKDNIFVLTEAQIQAVKDYFEVIA